MAVPYRRFNCGIEGVMGKSKPTGSIHKMGAHCGYTLFPDGSIDPAPTYKEQFAKLHFDTIALNETIATMNEHFIKHRRAIQVARDELFTRIGEDYGIDPKEGWVYEKERLSKMKQDAKP